MEDRRSTACDCIVEMGDNYGVMPRRYDACKQETPGKLAAARRGTRYRRGCGGFGRVAAELPQLRMHAALRPRRLAARLRPPSGEVLRYCAVPCTQAFGKSASNTIWNRMQVDQQARDVTRHRTLPAHLRQQRRLAAMGPRHSWPVRAARCSCTEPGTGTVDRAVVRPLPGTPVASHFSDSLEPPTFLLFLGSATSPRRRQLRLAIGIRDRPPTAARSRPQKTMEERHRDGRRAVAAEEPRDQPFASWTPRLSPA